MTTTREQTFSTLEAAEMAGVTYRQLDYWLRRGIIEISDDPQPGSGHSRRFTQTEVEALMEIVTIYRSAQAILREFTNGTLWMQAKESKRE
jgi:DNA-binding transcriptional MerR regulator